MWYFSPSGVYCNDDIRNEFIKKDNEEKIRINIIKKRMSTTDLGENMLIYSKVKIF